MRGNIITLYSFKILTTGLTLEELEKEYNSNKINSEEYNHLVKFYNRNLLTVC